MATDRKESSRAVAGKKQVEVDWDFVYQELLKTNAAVRSKVESGGTTKEQVVAWLKKNSGKVGFQKDADPSKKRRDK